MTLVISALTFAVMAFMVGPSEGLIGAMAAAGVCGMIFSFGCGIWGMIIPFQESVAQGLMYLFVPFYSLIYTITRWDRMRRPFLAGLVGGIMYVILVVSAVLLPAIAQARKAAQAAADRQQAGAGDFGAQPGFANQPQLRLGPQNHPEAERRADPAPAPAPEPPGPDIPRGPNGWGWINISNPRVEQPDGRGPGPGRPVYKLDYRVEGGRPLFGRLMVWVIESPGYLAKFNHLRFEPSGTLSGSLSGPIAAGGPYQTYIAVEKFDHNGPSLVKISPSLPIGDQTPAPAARPRARLATRAEPGPEPIPVRRPGPASRRPVRPRYPAKSLRPEANRRPARSTVIGSPSADFDPSACL